MTIYTRTYCINKYERLGIRATMLHQLQTNLFEVYMNLMVENFMF